MSKYSATVSLISVYGTRSPRRDGLGGCRGRRARDADDAIDVLQLGQGDLPVAVAAAPRSPFQPDGERLGPVLVRVLLRVVVHARAVQIADVVAAPGVRVVDVAVGAAEVAERLGPVAPAPQLKGVVDGVPRLVAEVHEHLFARVLEEVIVHQPPEPWAGQVPGDVDAHRAVGGPEVVIAQVVRRDEGDPLVVQLADHLLDALGERSLRTQLEIADARREQLLLADLADDRRRQQRDAARRSVPGAKCRDSHGLDSFTMSPGGNPGKTQGKIFPRRMYSSI